MDTQSSNSFDAVETDFRSTISRLCRDRFPDFQTEAHYNTVPRTLVSELATIGLMGLSVPEEFGGLGANAQLTAVAMETISSFDLGPAIFTSVHAMVAGLISRWGTSDQKQKILPKLASGEWLAAFALTEPQAGSDAAALRTRATPATGKAGYVINGDKCYISGAGFADLYLVFARTNPSEGNDGISAFLVESNAVGLSIGKPERKMGCELSPIASMMFTDVFVPAESLLGEVDKGFRVAMSGLARGRLNIAACANGLSLAAVEKAKAHLLARKQFGQVLADFQGLQFMLADMHIQTEAARALVRQSATALDESSKSSASIAASAAKCFATDVAMRVTTDAVQLLGGAGYLEEFHVERLMREAKMLQIVEGTNQIQRVIISRAMLQG